MFNLARDNEFPKSFPLKVFYKSVETLTNVLVTLSISKWYADPTENWMYPYDLVRSSNMADGDAGYNVGFNMVKNEIN